MPPSCQAPLNLPSPLPLPLTLCPFLPPVTNLSSALLLLTSGPGSLRYPHSCFHLNKKHHHLHLVWTPQSSPSSPRSTIFLPSNPNPLLTTTTTTIYPSAGCQVPSSSRPRVLSTSLNIHEVAEGRLNFPLAMTIIRHLGPEGEKHLAQLTESPVSLFGFSLPYHRIFVLFIPDISSLSDRRRKSNNQDYLSDSLFCITALHYPIRSIFFLASSASSHHQLSPSPCIFPPHHPNKNESLTFQSTFTYIRLAYTPPPRHGLQIYVRFTYLQSHV